MKFSSSTNIALASIALSPNLLSSPVFAAPTPDAGALSPNLNTGCFSGPPHPQATNSPLTQGAPVFSESPKPNAVPTFLITPAAKVAGRCRFIKRSNSAKFFDGRPTHIDRGAEDTHKSGAALGVDLDFFGSTHGSGIHIRADNHNNQDDARLPSANIATETPPDYNSPPLLGPYPSHPHPVTTPDRLGGLVPAWIYPHGNPIASASPADAGGSARTVLGTPNLWPIHGLTYSTALTDGKKDSADNRKNQRQVEAEGHGAQHDAREHQFPPRTLIDLESPFLSSPIPHDEPTFPPPAHTHYAYERVKRDIVPNPTGTSSSNSPQVQKGPSDSLSWTDTNGPLLVGATDPKTIPVWGLPNIAPPPLSGASKLPDGSFGIPVSVPNDNRLPPLPDIGGGSVFPKASAVGDPSVSGTGHLHYIPNVEGIGSAVGYIGAGMGGLTSAIPKIGGLASGVLGTPNIGDPTNGLPTGSIVNGLLGVPDPSVLPANGRLSEATKQLDTINPMLKPVADPISSLGTTPLSAPQPGSLSVPGFNAVPIPVFSSMPGLVSGANAPVNSLPVPFSISPEQIQPTAPLQTAPNPISVVSGAAQVSNEALGGQGVSDVRGLALSENNPLATTSPLMNPIMNPYPLPGTIPLVDPGFTPLPSPVVGATQQDIVGLGGQSVTAGSNRFAPVGSTLPTVLSTDSHVVPALASLPIPAADQVANVPPLPVSTHPFVVAVDPAPKAPHTLSDPSGIVSGAEVAPDDTSSSAKPTLGSEARITHNNMIGMVPGLNMPLASKTNNTSLLPSPNQAMPIIDPIRVIPSPPSSVSGMPSGLPSVVTSGRVNGTVVTISDTVGAVPDVGGTIPSTVPSAVLLPLPSETPNPMYSTMPIPDPVSLEDPNKITSHFLAANLHTLSNGLTEPSVASDNNKNEGTVGAYETKQAGMGAMGRPDGFVEVKQTKEDSTDGRKDEVAAGNMGKTGSGAEDGLDGGGTDKVSTGSKPSHTIENDGNKTAWSSSIPNSKIEPHTEPPAFLFSPSSTHSKTLPTITTTMASSSLASLIIDQTPNKSGRTESLPTRTSHMETPTPSSQRSANWAGPGRRLRVRILPEPTVSSAGLPTAHGAMSSVVMPDTKVPGFEPIDLPDDLSVSSDSDNNPAIPTSMVTGLPHPTPIYLGGSSLARMDEISTGLGVIDTTGTTVDPNIGGIVGWSSALNRIFTSTLRATATITGEESTPTAGKVLRM